ncbi:MAG: DUF2842 domain-containing protein [Paracoccaceae bacterium]
MFDKLSYKARRRWALVVLVVGMPLYVVACVTVVNMIGRPPIAVEFLVYVALGLAWILPFRGLFRGIGKPDPEAEAPRYLDDDF